MKKPMPFLWSVQSWLQSEMFLSNYVDMMKNLPRPIKALNLSSSHCNESHSEREITISSDTEFPEVTELLFIRLISLEFWSDVEFRLWVERTNFCSSVKTKVTRPSSEIWIHQNIWIKFRNQNLWYWSNFFIMSTEFDKKHFRLKPWLHWLRKWHWFFHETC